MALPISYSACPNSTIQVCIPSSRTAARLEHIYSILPLGDTSLHLTSFQNHLNILILKMMGMLTDQTIGFCQGVVITVAVIAAPTFIGYNFTYLPNGPRQGDYLQEPPETLPLGSQVTQPLQVPQAPSITQALTDPAIDDDLWRANRIIDRKELDRAKNTILAGSSYRQARTIPNSRLKIAFGVDNAFTTDDKNRAQIFIQEAKKRMQQAVKLPQKDTKNATADWNDMISYMKSAIIQELGNPGTSIDLAMLVQSVTLNVSFRYLFGVTEDNLARNQAKVRSIAHRVNWLWMMSKAEDLNDMPKWTEQREMHEHLLRITGLDPLHPVDNPMNLILPAYETMWRAVFRGLHEIYFRDRDGNNPKLWRSLLATYLSDQSDCNWKYEDDVFQLNAIDVIKEVVRLYPPTRRIARKHPEEEDYLHADLEQLHRHPRLAGNDPESFRPHRWVQIKENFTASAAEVDVKAHEVNKGYMPFAKVCPAGKSDTKAFGWKMIALLMASIIRGLDALEGTWKLKAEEYDEFPELGTALKSGRMDYLSLVLKKVVEVEKTKVRKGIDHDEVEAEVMELFEDEAS